MANHNDLPLYSDQNETEETRDPIRARHVAPAQDLVNLKISKRSSLKQKDVQNSNGEKEKPTRISISRIPRGEISDLISDNFPRNGDKSVFMMTIAGENIGATMEITNPGNQFLPTPNVNNNVQNINNSSLQDSSCVARDPGVYLDIISRNKNMNSENHVDKKESKLKEREKGLNLDLERKLGNQPPVRRRCLRALFMESDSDIEDLGKPRRHGCKYKCEGKREKGEEREKEKVIDQFGLNLFNCI